MDWVGTTKGDQSDRPPTSWCVLVEAIIWHVNLGHNNIAYAVGLSHCRTPTDDTNHCENCENCESFIRYECQVEISSLSCPSYHVDGQRKVGLGFRVEGIHWERRATSIAEADVRLHSTGAVSLELKPSFFFPSLAQRLATFSCLIPFGALLLP